MPQILSNRSDEFVYTASRLIEYGYDEINLNLGCPSGTVVSKGRGSGFLAKPEELNRFLDDIFHSVRCRFPSRRDWADIHRMSFRTSRDL